ncbi:MAG: hypothetical protein KA352_15785, partial [Flavobacteriales bacterium]|nr:hypothetical protein [Flavobacteriales bacterium]
LVEAVPDTTEPYPIHAPVVGTITLYEGLTGSSTVGGVVASSVSRTWSALDTGYYRVEFAPDAGCQIAMDTIYVPAVLNVGDIEEHITSALSLASSITDETLMLRSRDPAERISITVRDACGRTVLETSAALGPFSVERLVPGPYFLTAVQGREELRARFIKR